MTAVARTFLFTDIEGSTQQWERHPEAMPAAMAVHDTIMEQAVAGNGGRIFKTVGDAVCAVFDSPIAGARTAIEAQRALHATDWRALGLTQPLTVRMALQVGEAEARDGDFAGPVLNRIARLLRAGHGGQILLCEPIARELEQAALPGVRVRDMGARRLRDVPGANHIFQVEIEGLSTSFPPLITLDPIAHNLPAQLDACLARDAELAEIRRLLLDSPTRLVTLLGPGGIGKTRLALHAAWQLVDSFADGVWFVDLSGVRAAESIPLTVAAMIGARIEPGRDPVRAIAEWVGDRRLLLILDNCEQIVEGVASFVATLLPLASGVRVLVTSRISLRIRGEQRIEIGPLPVELDDEAGPAVQLFLERAQQLRPGFELTTDNQASIIEICYQVDGIPLALELAAARVTVMSPDALSTRLSSRLAVLTSSSRDLPERHRTLRAAIDWSYTLLAADEQRAFRFFSIFRGGWSFAAAQAVLDLGESATMEMLASLHDKSLVRLAETNDGETRYTMLETIQEYGLEKLTANEESDQVYSAYRAFFCTVALEASNAIQGGPHQQRWLGVIDREIANLRAALQSSLDTRDANTAVDLAIHLWYYWSARGLMDEGQRWLSSALTLTDAIDRTLRARALLALGNLCVERGELPAAETLYRGALDISHNANHELGVAQSLSFLGMVSGMQGRSDEEYTFQIDALERCRALGVSRGIASSLVNLAVWALNQGEFDQALDFLDLVKEEHERLRDEAGMAFGMAYRGYVLRGMGEFDAAADHFEDAEALLHRYEMFDGVSFAQFGRVSVELQRGNVSLAALLAEEALGRSRARGDRLYIADALELMAGVCVRTGEMTQGAALLGAAHYLRELSNAPAAKYWAAEFSKTRDELAAALGARTFSTYWERGRQNERRSTWLVVAPPGLLELVASVPA